MFDQVLGVDTAGSRWHAVLCDRNEQVLDTFCQSDLKGKRWKDPNVRLVELHRTAMEKLRGIDTSRTVVALEEALALSKNPKTTRILGAAYGAMVVALAPLGFAVVPIDVAQWKKSVICNGNASKDQIVEFWNDRGVYYAEQDSYDAHSLAVFGVRYFEVVA